jgi:hypothetical protein
MVGYMAIHKIVLFAAAAALSGCASINGPVSDSPSLQRAVYVVDPASTGAKAKLTSSVARADAAKVADKMPGESKLMRIYWFLGGR